MLPIMKPRSSEQLRNDALAIWLAAVEAVRSERLVEENICLTGESHTRPGLPRSLQIADIDIDLDQVRRIVVVGAGKAGAGMATGLERALGNALLKDKQVTGWVNVPSDCVRPLERIHLHPARPAGLNEPTPEAVAGSREILDLVSSLGADDLCIALISGGGSALLPLPLTGVSLDDKLAVTRCLSAAGAPIDELNTVRKQLSQIKGGRLAAACRAGQLVTLIISDVLGDPLDLIASGPTVPDSSTAADALAILERYDARQAGISPHIFDLLAEQKKHDQQPSRVSTPFNCRIQNKIIGNNALAVAAAVHEAQRRGYVVQSHAASQSEGPAEDVGQELAHIANQMQTAGAYDAWVSGGEPTVKLIDAKQRGRGGRNQQLVLAAVKTLGDAQDIVLLSGGTDGEDGPTDAAGAWVDQEVIATSRLHGLEPDDFLSRNDAYHWFEPLGALLKTGPTHTNVCDIRVVLTASHPTRSTPERLD